MADEGAPAPKKKKLPFKPTALRRAPKPVPKEDNKESDDDGLDLFRRSKEMAPIMAADRERRMRRKQKHEEERRRSITSEKRPHDDLEEDEAPVQSSVQSSVQRSMSRETSHLEESQPAVDESMTVVGDSFSELVTPPPSKRSRIGSVSSKRPSESTEPPESTLEASPSARCLSARRHPSPPRQPIQEESVTSSAAPIISLDSDSDDDDFQPMLTPTNHRSSSIEILGQTTPQPSAPEPEPEEDEFAEYVRRAEEQRARDQALLQSGLDGETVRESADIQINSTIPGAGPLRVKMRFDKALRLVRETWIAIQKKKGLSLTPDEWDDIVLTWRSKKVYNFTTLLGLGIRPQGDRLVADGPGRDGFIESQTMVHMEAWTLELFQQMELDEELQRRRDAGEISDEEVIEEPVEEIKLKVILKSRELEDLKLMVRPETTVETLITGFRTQRNLGSDRDVSLWFDGEKLEEHVTMDEAEIDDMDTIEVHVK